MRNFSKGIECPIARLKAAPVFDLLTFVFNRMLEGCPWNESR